jgi:hypothetical protein
VLEVSAPAPGQTEVFYLIIIYLKQDQANDKNRCSFQKTMKKLCKQVSTKLKSEPELNLLRVGAGAKRNSFVSAALRAEPNKKTFARN